MNRMTQGLEKTCYATPFGTGIMLWRHGLLAGHLLPGKGESQGRYGEGVADERAKTLRKKLESYFLGRRVEFTRGELPIDWLALSEFEQKVADALMDVAYGKTTSYADLAAAAGYPRAHRAVGNFMAKNRFPVLIPCHRVVRGDGSPGNYSAGSHWKLRLLELEGVRL